MSQKYQIKVIAVLSCCGTPAPVITATTGRGDRKATYVYLSYEERSELFRMGNMVRADLTARDLYDGDLIRGYQIDPETGVREASTSDRRVSWINGEGVWAEASRWHDDTLAMTRAWARVNRRDGGSDKIPALNWIAWTALRRLAIAATGKDLRPSDFVMQDETAQP